MRNLNHRTRRLSYQRSTDHDHGDNSSIESTDVLISPPHGNSWPQAHFQGMLSHAWDRNPFYICMERGLCEAELREPPAGPASDAPKSIETNKIPIIQVKKKHIDCSKRRAHFLVSGTSREDQSYFATNIMAGNKMLQTTKSPWPTNNG